MSAASDDLYRVMAIELSRYNRWQNETLYALCAALPEEELRRDAGLFFGSLLGTLNHLLHTDRVILRILREGRPPDTFDPRQRIHDDFASLRRARVAQDDEIEALFRDAPAGWLAEDLRFTSARLGRERRVPRALYVTQLFNHQTHHRSQVTTALQQRGIDYGATDLPANPLSQF